MSRLSDEELDEALAVAQSLNSLRLTAAVAELKERRAQDLTPNEIEHLVILRDMVDVNTKACRTRATTAALAVLDKLLAGRSR